MTLKLLIHEAASEANKLFIPAFEEFGEDIVLYGTGGIFDSLELVRFVLSLENKIKDSFGVSIELTSEKSLSLKRSPFNTFKSVEEFVKELLDV